MIIATSSYNDLLVEIDIINIRIKTLKNEHKQMQKMMYANAPKGLPPAIDYSEARITGGFVPLSLDKVVDRINKIAILLGPLYLLVEEKVKMKDYLENKMGELESLEDKIVFMRDAEKKTLKVIAKELGYSYDWVRKISSKTRHKEGTGN